VGSLTQNIFKKKVQTSCTDTTTRETPAEQMNVYRKLSFNKWQPCFAPAWAKDQLKILSKLFYFLRHSNGLVITLMSGTQPAQIKHSCAWDHLKKPRHATTGQIIFSAEISCFQLCTHVFKFVIELFPFQMVVGKLMFFKNTIWTVH